MPYTIQFTDSTNKDPIVVQDGTINNETSINLPGKNSTGYGQVIAEDLLHLLENFASATEPTKGIEGQLWYNNNTNQLLIYDSTRWVPAGGLIKSTNEPDTGSANDGDLWVDTDNQQLYLFSGSTWVLVGPTFSEGLSTGAFPTTVIGQDNVEYTILEIQVRAQTVAIIAFDTFIPKATIPGFAAATIQPGINLANRDTTGDGINNVKFYGTAEKAESLIVNDLSIPAANFLRGDAESTTTSGINVQNNSGISYGINGELNIGIEGSAAILQHNIEGSNIDVRVRNSGSSSTVLRVDSSLRVGINNVAPDEALDVTGNLLTSGTIKTNDVTESTSISDGSLVIKGGAGIAKTLNVGENVNIAKTLTLGNIDLTVDTNESDVLLPDSNNTRDIGRSDLKFRRMYATTFIGNLEGIVSGNISGKAGSADKLTSATTFRLLGDVETVEQSFDGQSGGGLKEFDVTIKNSLISSKELVTVSQADDDFLIDRTSGSTGLKRISRSSLFSAISGLTPIGSIMPYAGTAEPSGWKFCNGQELAQGLYSSLFELIGYTYGPENDVVNPLTPGYFRLPDLRGRFALGNLAMGGTAPAVETPDSRARGTNPQTLGADDGSDEVSIDIENLPEHQHTLEDLDNRQFHAVREEVGIGDRAPGVTDSKFVDGADNQSEKLSNSGNIKTEFTQEELDRFEALGIPITGNVASVGNALNVMNPYLTINYIIYTGRLS
jgi:microcystin-dependent protein